MPRPVRRRPLVRLAAALVVVSLTACSATGAAEAEPVVTVLGQLGGADRASFETVAAAFSADNGVRVQYEEVGDVAEELDRRRRAAEDNDMPGVRDGARGELPDVVLVPSVELPELVDAAHLRPLDGVVDGLETALQPVLRAEGTVDGRRWAVPFRAEIDSLVWYRPDVFAARGYEVPGTYDELVALLDRSEADGTAPWCVGVESGQDTGWILTDWFEDLVLRTAGPQGYDRWADGELPFDSPEVLRAGELFEELVLEDGRVRGGRLALLTTPLTDAPAGMFEDPPGCLLHRQGTVSQRLFADLAEGEEEIEVGEDVAVFPFPPVDDRGGLPLVGATEVAALVSGDPAAERLVRHLGTPAAGAQWLAADEDVAFLSPYVGFDPAAYANDAQREQARILSDAGAFRPDASLSMPEWLGGYALNWALVDWVWNQRDLVTALRDIDRPDALSAPSAAPAPRRRRGRTARGRGAAGSRNAGPGPTPTPAGRSAG
jgi:alpha-glucoside transport system substrate-binding protein